MSVRLFDRIPPVFSILLNFCLIVVSNIKGKVLKHIWEIRINKIYKKMKNTTSFHLGSQKITANSEISRVAVELW